jgi:hypothetical protein
VLVLALALTLVQGIAHRSSVLLVSSSILVVNTSIPLMSSSVLLVSSTLMRKLLLVGALTSKLLILSILQGSKLLRVNSLPRRLLMSPLPSLMLIGSLAGNLAVHTAARATRMGAQSTLLRDGMLVAAVVLLLGESLGILLLGSEGVRAREKDEGLRGAGLGVGLFLLGELNADFVEVRAESLELRLGVLDVRAGGHHAGA